MKNSTIFTIMKKELARFFGDSRMVLTTIILPGLLIFVMYTLMGTALKEQYQSDLFEADAYCIHLPEEWTELLSEQGFQIREIDQEDSKIQQAKQKVKNQEYELFVIFPENFIQETQKYISDSNAAASEVQVYYNSASADSVTAYHTFTAWLDQYKASLANPFSVNTDTENTYDLATQEDTTAQIFSSMVPFLLLLFLYSGCIAVAPESIAGEKERGTMAALLITPAKRSHIALGKISALSIIAVLSGISSALGTLLSVPKLLSAEDSGIDQAVYSWSDYLLLVLVILSTALILITMISLVSAFARSLKEAQTYVMPLMILVMLVGVTALFGKEAKTALVYYCIPLYNSVQAMVGIFSFHATGLQILTTVLVNLAATGIGSVILANMFDNEYMMFHK